jgi:hypothetical protein
MPGLTRWEHRSQGSFIAPAQGGHLVAGVEKFRGLGRVLSCALCVVGWMEAQMRTYMYSRQPKTLEAFDFYGGA